MRFSSVFSSQNLLESFCWTIRSFGSGGKGVNYLITSNNNTLTQLLVLENLGWEGEGKAKACIEKSNWGRLDSNRFYTFSVTGSSVLFGTTTTTSFTFRLSPPSSSLIMPRQEMNCGPSLWDSSPTSLYGIQTYPSGHNFFPSSLRSSPLIIATKALSPCPQYGMSKDILASSSFFWEFVDGAKSIGLDPNDWVSGTRLVIPETILSNREVFPPNQPVEIRVTVDVGGGDVFVAELSIEFLPYPIEMVVQGGFSSIYDVSERLLIDFSNSLTLDGVVVGGAGWIWEWEWSCVIPGQRGQKGRECVYENGDMVVMPGEGEERFEGEDAMRFEEGVPLYFSVRGRVRKDGGGEIWAEGTWSSVINPVGGMGVGLELREEEWMCSDSSVGYQVFSN